MFYHSNTDLLFKKNNTINLFSDYSVKGSDAVLSGKPQLSSPVRSDLLTFAALRQIKEATKLVWIAFSEGRFIVTANLVRFLVLTAMIMIITLFWDVTSYVPTFQKIQLPPPSR
jgi:hypothetical protein